MQGTRGFEASEPRADVQFVQGRSIDNNCVGREKARNFCSREKRRRRRSWKMMLESPKSLQALCVDAISKDLESLCEVDADNGPSSSGVNYFNWQLDNAGSEIRFKRSTNNENVTLPSRLAEYLLTRITEEKKLPHVFLTLFRSKFTALRHVTIKSAKKLNKDSLMILKQHNIIDLEIRGLKISINELLDCLSAWTVENLRSLRLPNATFTDNTSSYLYRILKMPDPLPGLWDLHALRALNLSGTDINSGDLDKILEHLGKLENLDISDTLVQDLEPLMRCKDTLKILTMRNVGLRTADDPHVVISKLDELRTLDISVSRDYTFLLDERRGGRPLIIRVLAMPLFVMKLRNLDISGEPLDAVDVSLIIAAHPELRFLGIVGTHVGWLRCFTDTTDEDYHPDRVVAGMANVVQLIATLKHYTDRSSYLDRAIEKIISLGDNYFGPRYEVDPLSEVIIANRFTLIELIIPIMRLYPRKRALQARGCAALYYLTKGDLAKNNHPSVLRQIVDVVLNAIDCFVDYATLQGQAATILHNEEIIENANFDTRRCAMSLMYRLFTFRSNAIDAMLVQMFYSLTRRMLSWEASELGHSDYIVDKLLSYIKMKVSTKTVDNTMGFAMSSLRELTHRNAEACLVFLNHGGLDIYMDVLNTFPDHCKAKINVLRQYTNIAECGEMRLIILTSDFMKKLMPLMDSTTFKVSYHAAELAATLLSDGPEFWTDGYPTKTELLDKLEDKVTNWVSPRYEIHLHRGFERFFPLLRATEPFPVQLWAVWAVHHACTMNPVTYCHLLRKNRGDEVIEHLEVDSVDADQPRIIEYCSSILDTLELYP